LPKKIWSLCCAVSRRRWRGVVLTKEKKAETAKFSADFPKNSIYILLEDLELSDSRNLLSMKGGSLKERGSLKVREKEHGSLKDLWATMEILDVCCRWKTEFEDSIAIMIRPESEVGLSLMNLERWGTLTRRLWDKSVST